MIRTGKSRFQEKAFSEFLAEKNRIQRYSLKPLWPEIVLEEIKKRRASLETTRQRGASAEKNAKSLERNFKKRIEQAENALPRARHRREQTCLKMELKAIDKYKNAIEQRINRQDVVGGYEHHTNPISLAWERIARRTKTG